jgi:hypothetical protein
MYDYRDVRPLNSSFLSLSPDLSRNRPRGFGGFHIDGNAVSQALAVFYLPTKSKSLTFSRSNSMEKRLRVTISTECLSLPLPFDRDVATLRRLLFEGILAGDFTPFWKPLIDRHRVISSRNASKKIFALFISSRIKMPRLVRFANEQDVAMTILPLRALRLCKRASLHLASPVNRVCT